jgi:transcriptional regulator with XRE-family HTH domain
MQFSHNFIMSEYLKDEIYYRKYQEFLQRLKASRIAAGMTQQEAAAKLGKSQSFVSRSEKGERRIDIIELQAFAKIYETNVTDFFD